MKATLPSRPRPELACAARDACALLRKACWSTGRANATGRMMNRKREHVAEWRQRDCVVRASRRLDRSHTSCVRPYNRSRIATVGAHGAEHLARSLSPRSEREFMTSALRALEGERIRSGDSWGTSARTIRGVFARSGLRGPGPAVFEGGETRFRARSGTRARDRFPATALPGEGRAKRPAGSADDR
mgnify:CR=1 FL=1